MPFPNYYFNYLEFKTKVKAYLTRIVRALLNRCHICISNRRQEACSERFNTTFHFLFFFFPSEFSWTTSLGSVNAHVYSCFTNYLWESVRIIFLCKVWVRSKVAVVVSVKKQAASRNKEQVDDRWKSTPVCVRIVSFNYHENSERRTH